MMLSGVFFLPFLNLLLQAVAAPSSSNDSLVKSDSTPTIDAKVTDRDGLDITSSFEVRLYDESKNQTTTANDTHRRRQPAELSRPIIECQLPNAIFMESICTYESDQTTGMQGWEMACYLMKGYSKPKNRKFYPGIPISIRLKGQCNENEICVDGANGVGGDGWNRLGRRSIASCVRKDYFTRMISMSGKAADQRPPLSDLNGKRAQVVVSKLDETTPLEVNKFDVETFNAKGDTVQSKECHDCLDLSTDKFGSNTKGLRAEATLMKAGLTAGIIWVAVMSG